jgi:membrane protease YdiL (CAAX protease family)
MIQPDPGRSAPVRRGRRGAVAQVLLFLAVWSALVSLFGLLFGLLAVLPALRGARPGAADPSPMLGASSPATLAAAAVTVLATALAVWIMRRFLAGPSLLDLGLRPRPGWLADTVFGLALGPAMFLAILLLLLAAGWTSVEAGAINPAGLAVAFLTFVLVAFAEEVLARGWVLQVLEQGRGTKAAVIGSAGVFSLLHAFNPGFGLMALLGLFLAGLLFAQAYLVTRQLWLPIAFHLSWNFSEGPLFGFPVSGLPGEGLITVKPSGPALVTGGAFGPEAGLVVVVGIALAALAIAAYGRWRSARHLSARPRAELGS